MFSHVHLRGRIVRQEACCRTGGSNPPPSAPASGVPRFAGLDVRPCLTCTLFDHLQVLPQLDHAAVGENAAKVYAGVNHAIAADDRAGIDHCVTTDFRAIANDSAESPEACWTVSIGRYDRDFAVLD